MGRSVSGISPAGQEFITEEAMGLEKERGSAPVNPPLIES